MCSDCNWKPTESSCRYCQNVNHDSNSSLLCTLISDTILNDKNILQYEVSNCIGYSPRDITACIAGTTVIEPANEFCITNCTSWYNLEANWRRQEILRCEGDFLCEYFQKDEWKMIVKAQVRDLPKIGISQYPTSL